MHLPLISSYPLTGGKYFHNFPFNSQEDAIKDHQTARNGGRLVISFCNFRIVISYSFLKYNILKSNFKIQSLDNRCSMQRQPQPYKNAAKNIRCHSAGCCSTRLIASATLWVMLIVSDLKFFSSLSRFPEEHNSFLVHRLRL